MDYENHYYTLIEKARNRTLTGYKEAHHVVPRCAGGTDDPNNLIELTPEEHFVAHQLLLKIFQGTELEQKMAYGVVMMTANKYGNRRGNKLFGWVRRRVAATRKGVPRTPEERQAITRGLTGRKHSPETRAKQSAAKAGKPPWNKGRKLSEEHKAALRAAKRKPRANATPCAA